MKIISTIPKKCDNDALDIKAELYRKFWNIYLPGAKADDEDDVCVYAIRT